MKTCLLCNEREAKMEFNTPTHRGMLVANICLECWAEFPGDTDIANTIIRKRREAMIDLFGFPHDIVSHWSDVPEDKQAAVLSYLLKGASCSGVSGNSAQLREEPTDGA